MIREAVIIQDHGVSLFWMSQECFLLLQLMEENGRTNRHMWSPQNHKGSLYFLTTCSHENGISHNERFNHLLKVPISQHHHHHNGNQISTWVWRGQTTRKQSAVKFQYCRYKRSDLASNKVMGSVAAFHLSMWGSVEAARFQPLHSFSTAQRQAVSGCLTAPNGAWRRLFRCVLFSGTRFMSR